MYLFVMNIYEPQSSNREHHLESMQTIFAFQSHSRNKYYTPLYEKNLQDYVLGKGRTFASFVNGEVNSPVKQR